MCKYGRGISAQKYSSGQELLKSSSGPETNFCAKMAMADMHFNSLWYRSALDTDLSWETELGLERELYWVKSAGIDNCTTAHPLKRAPGGQASIWGLQKWNYFGTTFEVK